METSFPTCFVPNSTWSKEENKMFESAIAIFDENIPNRWSMIAAMIPGKTVVDVIKQYKELAADVCNIEAGILVPIPSYFASSVMSELVDNSCRLPTLQKKRCSPDQDKKKGLPWTEEEHRRFLMGLEKYGKGDWRNISRKLVISRTPAQVASHAQKYYQRQLSGGKEKRRPSIHDITTVHPTVDLQPNEESRTISPLQQFTTTTDVASSSWWNNSNDDDLMAPFALSFDGSYPFEISSVSNWDVYGFDITNVM